MSYPDEDRVPGRTPTPIDVQVRNWDGMIRRKRPSKTTLKTYILNPADPPSSQLQICTNEPTRTRLVIVNYDANIALVAGAPARTSPDTATNATACEGAFLPSNSAATPWEFFGSDALWINSLGTITRVTVIKEYE